MNVDPVRKDPGTITAFGIDWSTRPLGALTITASEWEAPSGITVEDDSFFTTSTNVQVSGGTDGEDYDLFNTVTLNDGQTDIAVLRVYVRAVESWTLTPAEIVRVARITNRSYGEVEEQLAFRNGSQVASIIANLAKWIAVEDSFVTYKDDADFDNERKRNDIRERILSAMGWPSLMYDTGASGSTAVPNLFIF